ASKKRSQQATQREQSIASAQDHEWTSKRALKRATVSRQNGRQREVHVTEQEKRAHFAAFVQTFLAVQNIIAHQRCESEGDEQRGEQRESDHCREAFHELAFVTAEHQ